LAAVGLWSAWSAVHAAEKADVVNLPAFVVDGADGKSRPVHWLCAELPGMRLLSCASPEATEMLVAALRDQTRLYHWTLPADIELENGGPLLVILDDRPSTSLRLLLNEKQAEIRAGTSPRATVVGAAIVEWDFATLFRQQGRLDPALAAAGFVADASNAILSQRAGWTHIERVVSRARLNTAAVGNGIDIIQSPLSLAERKLPLPSLAGLFSTSTPATEAGAVASQEELARWFARWALFADDGSRAPALWKFARATASRPRLDDEMAQYYFGIPLATMEVYVSRFRSRSQSTPGLHLRLPSGAPTPLSEVRDATEEEIAVGVIEWCLLAGRYSPALRAPLQEASRRAIERVRKAGQVTPQVVAMAGLSELVAGNVTDARVLLEDVADEPRLNSRARLEVAKLRFADASAAPAAMGRKFSAEQSTKVLGPLAVFLTKPPASSEPLQLIVQTWAQSEKAPAKEDVRAMVAAAKLFPGDDDFLLETARYCELNGFRDEAASLAGVGLASAQTEEARQSFSEMSKRD
jgi:hypothetical protein